jgi:hypothetical protein
MPVKLEVVAISHLGKTEFEHQIETGLNAWSKAHQVKSRGKLKSE